MADVEVVMTENIFSFIIEIGFQGSFLKDRPVNTLDT